MSDIVIRNWLMKKAIFLLFIFSLYFTQAYSQKEGLNWYFGYGAGLKFHNGYPEPLNDGSLITVEGCSTISDYNGNLMFYTDGITVYNRNHSIMYNGTGLLGDPSATQSGVIVPVPDHPAIYYIFTVTNLDIGCPNNGFCYSKVDMNLDGGLGGVVNGEKNVELIAKSTERVTSVIHHNKNGIWVIAHEWESRDFYAYLITSDGLDINNPVLSDVGIFQSGEFAKGKGYMKVSPDGSKLAISIMGMDKIQLFDFNDETGEVSELLVDLFVEDSPYGVEFSKKARFLYATERYGNKVYQWDVQAGSPQAIIDSRTVIGTLASKKGGAMQMASDSKIYLARQSKYYLSVINEPSFAGTTCDFQEIGVDLNGSQSQEGLPSFIQSYFNNLFIITQNYCLYDTIFLSLNDTTDIDSVYWSFGDPASGVNNHSTELFTFHRYEQPGDYNINVISYHLTTTTEANQSIRIYNLAKVDVGSDTAICIGDTITLYANHDTGYIYKWLDDESLNKRTLKISEEGYYWVEGKNLCNTDIDSVYLYVRELPEVDLGRDTTIKYNSIVMLDAGYSNDYYLWQDGSSNQYYDVDYPGTYWVEVTDDIGCKSSDTVSITAIPFRVYMPTAFSPDNNGVNDIFIPRSTYDVEIDFELTIFDRWGEIVFKTTDIKQGWDGTYNGMKCPNEVYIWHLNAATYEQNEFFGGATQMIGNVTLIR